MFMVTVEGTPLERAKNILSLADSSADPAISAALAQAWALLAIAERLEELAQVTREVNRNPPLLKAAPFSRTAAPPAAVALSAPAFPSTAPVMPKKRLPTRVLPGP